MFKAQGYNSRLKVMVSESPDMSSFTDVVYDGIIDGEYSEIECDLTQYSKKNIYLAWVQSADEDSESSISIDDVIVIEYLTKSGGDENLVKETALHQNYPNPFNNSTMICFDLLNAGNVEIKVYNYQGQLVRTVANRHFEQGKYRLEWDGRSDRGESVSSGMYIYHMTTDGYSKIRKMIFMK